MFRDDKEYENKYSCLVADLVNGYPPMEYAEDEKTVKVLEGSVCKVYHDEVIGEVRMIDTYVLREDTWIKEKNNSAEATSSTNRLQTENLEQDNTAPGFILEFSQLQSERPLTVVALKDAYQVTIADTTGIIEGDQISLVNLIGNRYYVGKVTNVVSGTVIQLDTRLDFQYEVGDYVGIGKNNMAVNGTMAAPQSFRLRGNNSDKIPIEIDVTRIIFSCLCATSVNLAKFADIAALTNGLVLRRIDGETENIFNVKSNRELDGITMDWKPYQAINPNQGQDGFTCRLTFNGKDKMGIVKRLGPGEDLEFLVQDPMGAITFLGCVAEGHLVVD